MIGGQGFDLDARSVSRALSRVLPEPLKEHYVVIGGRRYPPKQVIGLVTGLDRADFTTHQARRILLRLGFPAARTSKKAPRRNAKAGRRSERPSHGDALRPYIGQWVATLGGDVLVAAESPSRVVAWLAEHGKTAESMFRVPDSEEAAAGVAPR